MPGILKVILGSMSGSALVWGTSAWAQVSPYVYVQMSMAVPWFLYFVFLACILLPFFVMIIVAWRRYFANNRDRLK